MRIVFEFLRQREITVYDGRFELLLKGKETKIQMGGRKEKEKKKIVCINIFFFFLNITLYNTYSIIVVHFSSLFEVLIVYWSSYCVVNDNIRFRYCTYKIPNKKRTNKQ